MKDFYIHTNFNGENKSLSLENYDFLKKRKISISEDITPEVAEKIVSAIEYLEEQEDNDIHIELNSHGGEIFSAIAIVDKLRTTPCKTIVTVRGVAASAAALILSAGTFRQATPHSEVMIHQPRSVGNNGETVTEMEINAIHAKNLKKKVATILAENVGKNVDEVMKVSEVDCWMTSSEALAFGLIDRIEE